jgi:hypothetical protein
LPFPEDDGIVVLRSERLNVVDPLEYPFALRQRLTEGGSAGLAEVLNTERAEVIATVSHSFDQRLAAECGQLQRGLDALRADMRSEMNALRVELRADFQVAIADTKADLLKWSFLFWIGQVAAVVGLASVWSG